MVMLKLPEVAEVLRLNANTAPPASGIGVLVINYNTAAQTLRCLESIQQSKLLPDWVLVLDNASASDDYQRLLQSALPPQAGSLHIYRSETNLGFAQGSNVLIDLLLQNTTCQRIMLLNNDAVAHPDMLGDWTKCSTWLEIWLDWQVAACTGWLHLMRWIPWVSPFTPA